MNGFFVTLRITLRIAALWSTLSLLASCIAFIAPASAPEGVLATKGSEEDRVIITWNPVKRAGVYLLYRSSSKDGEYEYLASTDGTSYVDVKVIPLARYWYIVAAADFLGRPQSEKPSRPVEGWCFHTFSWESSTVALNASGFDLALNPSATGEAFLAWTGPEQEAPVNVEIYRETGWQNLTDSFGITNGSIAGSISIAVSADVPYVAYRDEASGGRLTAVYFDGNGEETAWTSLGSAGQSTGPVRELQSAFAGLDLYVAALDDSEPQDPPQPQLVVFRFSAATGWQDVSAGPPVTAPPSSLSLTGGPEPFLAYTDGNGAVAVWRYDDGWKDTGFTSSDGAVSVPDGYLDLCFDETTSNLVLAFYDSAVQALKVAIFDGENWSDMSVPVVADPQAGTLSVSADQGILYLFYKDLDSRRGTVLRYHDSTWEPLRQDGEIEGITGQYNLKKLAIEARQHMVFAIAQEGNSIQTDVYR